MHAQNGFTPKVEKYVDDYIASLKVNSSELKKTETWYAAFKKGVKPSAEQYSSSLIGIGVSALKEKGGVYNYVPAKYSFDKNKIGIKKITSKKYEQTDIDSYTKAFFKNNNAVLKQEKIYGNLDTNGFVVGAGLFKESDKEIYVKGSFDFLCIRVYKKYLYVVSLNKNFAVWKNREIAFYKFNLTSKVKGAGRPQVSKKKKAPVEKKQENSYKIPNRWKDTKRLYHDVASEELRKTVRLLSQIAPYNTNKEFVENTKVLNIPLDRDNIHNYIKELTFFQDYKIEMTDKMKNKLDYFSKESVKNINHHASHALADIYMNNKQYKKAIASYGKTLSSKYHTAGGTRYVRDLDRIYCDLAEASFAVNHHDEGVLYLLAVVANQNTSATYADKQLIAYGKTINGKKFKENLIWAINSVKPKGDSDYTITYKKQKGTFGIPIFSSPKGVKIRLAKSVTYGSFDYK